MGLPGKKLSKSSKRRRAAHFALEKMQLVPCKKCTNLILPHRVCAYCGTYKSRPVLATKADVLLKEVTKEDVAKDLAKTSKKK